MATETEINQKNVKITFTMRPQDSFNSNAVLKITLPPQLVLQDNSRVSGGTVGIVDWENAVTNVQFNRIIYITNAFPNGLNPVSTFDIQLSNFDTPPTTQPTDPFEIKIFYEEYVNEISHYMGSDLVFIATASNSVSYSVELTEDETGETQTKMTFTATMEPDNPIEKQSFIEVFIPSQFTLSNQVRTASTCTALSGFSDEIYCEFKDGSSNRNGHTLLVKGGFDSQTFIGSSFSFSIAEIKNPFDTVLSNKFRFMIND